MKKGETFSGEDLAAIAESMQKGLLAKNADLQAKLDHLRRESNELKFKLQLMDENQILFNKMFILLFGALNQKYPPGFKDYSVELEEFMTLYRNEFVFNPNEHLWLTNDDPEDRKRVLELFYESLPEG